MKGWNPKIIDRLPHHKRAGRVEAYPEIDLADPRAQFDSEACVMLRIPPPILTDVKIPGPSAIPARGSGPHYEVWCGRVRLWTIQSHTPMDEVERLADLAGYQVRNLRVVPVREVADTRSRVAVRSNPDADAVAQLTSRVRSQLLGRA